MIRAIFVHLSTKDVPRARAFYTALGFTVNEGMSGEKHVCIVMMRHHSPHAFRGVGVHHVFTASRMRHFQVPRSSELPQLLQQVRSRRSGPESLGSRRYDCRRSGRSRLHVSAQLPGSRWARVEFVSHDGDSLNRDICPTSSAIHDSKNTRPVSLSAVGLRDPWRMAFVSLCAGTY